MLNADVECIKDSGKNAKIVHASDLLFLHQNCFKYSIYNAEYNVIFKILKKPARKNS